MAVEFPTATRKKVFDWLRPRYHFASQLTAASHFDAFATRVDYLFKDTSDRKIGIVGRDLRDEPLTGVGAFAWGVSENATFEMADRTLNGVILVVLVKNLKKAYKARDLIANHLAKQAPKTFENDMVIGYIKKGKFEPYYLERSTF